MACSGVPRTCARAERQVCRDMSAERTVRAGRGRKGSVGGVSSLSGRGKRGSSGSVTLSRPVLAAEDNGGEKSPAVQTGCGGAGPHRAGKASPGGVEGKG